MRIELHRRTIEQKRYVLFFEELNDYQNDHGSYWFTGFGLRVNDHPISVQCDRHYGERGHIDGGRFQARDQFTRYETCEEKEKRDLFELRLRIVSKPNKQLNSTQRFRLEIFESIFRI